MLTPKILYQGQPTATNTDLYTVPTNKKVTVTAILAGNTNAATKHFTIHLVPSGQTVADSRVIGGKQKKLVGTSDSGGGGEWLYEVPTPMTVGDKISGIQEMAGAISIIIIGLEEDV